MDSRNKIILKKNAEYTGHKSSVYCLSTHAGKLYSAGSDRLLVRWDAPDEGESVAASTAAIYSMFFHHDDNTMLLGNAEGMIHVIDLANGKEIRNLKPFTSPVFKIFEVIEYGLLFFLSGEGVLSVYEKEDLKFIRNVRLSNAKLRSIVYDKSAKGVAVGCGEGVIHFVGLDTLENTHSFQAHESGFSVNTLLIHPVQGHIISGSRDGHIKAFSSYDTSSVVASIPAHNYAIYGMEFIKEDLMISASRDKTLKVWDISDYSFVQRLDEQHGGHKFSVNAMVSDPERNKIYSAGDDRLIIEWLMA